MRSQREVEVHAGPVSQARTCANPDPGSQWWGDGGRAVEERRRTRVARKAKVKGERAEPEACRRMVGSVIEEAARGAVKKAAQEAVEKTTQEAVREATQEAAQGAIY